MLKISVRLRLLLAIILISLPIGLISFFLSKKVFKKLIRTLNKIDSFDALLRFRRDLRYRWSIAIARISSRLHFKKKLIISPAHVPSPEHVLQDIINPKDTSLVDNDSIDTVPKTYDEEDKITLIKKRKLLEKIIYEALGLRKEGKLDEYEKKIIQGLAIDPDDIVLNKLLADLYFTMSNHKKALPILKKIVEIDPKDHKAIWQIGEIYLTSGDFDVAELLIQKSISINPTNPKYYISMVELMYNTDRKEDAIAEMEKVIKLRPTNSAYMLTIADLYAEINDMDNAKKYYFRVLEYEPSNEKAKKKLKELTGE